MEKRIRVRFAPSPTGPLHMGGVRTALYNYLFARQQGGDFILRIEDTDQSRFVPGAEEYIIESLKWCGILPNEGVGFGNGAHAPYRQSERKNLYRKYAEQLVRDGLAYYSFDTPEELEEMRKRMEAAKSAFSYNAVTRQSLRNSLTLSEDEVRKRLESGDPHAVRIKVPRNEEIRVKDIIRGWVVVHSSQMDDKVLFKSDGMPTYHLANVVDDYLMQITHVIRGEEWLPSAPLHVLLYRYLGWEEVMPEFAHLPLLLRPDGNGKLSKRDGDRLGFPVFPINWTDPQTGELSSGYREKGYLPEAFVNMLALLGWHPGGNQELFTMDELVKEFSLERVSKSGAKFDPEKTKWFNQQYLKKHSDDDIAAVLMRELKEADGFTAGLKEEEKIQFDKLVSRFDFVKESVRLTREKAHFMNEFRELTNYFFIRPKAYDMDAVSKKFNDAAASFFQALMSAFREASSFSHDEAEKIFKGTATGSGIKPGEVMPLFRIMLSGISGGPVLFEMAALLGRDEVVERIRLALEVFKKQHIAT
jgi:glutamyl-tRNA synthetase